MQHLGLELILHEQRWGPEEKYCKTVEWLKHKITHHRVQAEQANKRKWKSCMRELEKACEQSNSCTAIFGVLKARKMKSSMGVKMDAMYPDNDKEEEPIRDAMGVREESAKLGGKSQQKGVVFLEALERWMQWAKPREPSPDPHPTYERSMMTFDKFYKVLKGMRGSQGVGTDGFSLSILQQCPVSVIRVWWEAVVEMCFGREDGVVEVSAQWKKWVAVLLMKPGEDPMNFGRRRDIWLICHTVHLMDALLAREVLRVTSVMGGVSQAGFTECRGAPEVILCNRLCKEMACRDQIDFYRGYLDFSLFFMSIEHKLIEAIEEFDNMSQMARAVFKELLKDVTGRYDTAHGLSDSMIMGKGVGQGRVSGPSRSKSVAAKIQHATNKVVRGYRVWGGKRVPQGWFADDGFFMTNDLPMLQLAFDVCWWFSYIGGLDIGIKENCSKTYWQGMTGLMGSPGTPKGNLNFRMGGLSQDWISTNATNTWVHLNPC